MPASYSKVQVIVTVCPLQTTSVDCPFLSETPSRKQGVSVGLWNVAVRSPIVSPGQQIGVSSPGALPVEPLPESAEEECPWDVDGLEASLPVLPLDDSLEEAEDVELDEAELLSEDPDPPAEPESLPLSEPESPPSLEAAPLSEPLSEPEALDPE